MIFLIPARKGSKRLPGKNSLLFCGLPLWQWSLATALRVADRSDAVVVSTDDPEILKSRWAIERPAHLCTDTSPTQFLVDLFLPSDSVCLLQPTSPTRPDSLVRMMIDRGGASRSVTNGVPNGQCWIYRTGMEQVDVETERGYDIDTLADFCAAEEDMRRRFA